MHAIDEADPGIPENLFAGVIAQIPTNLYLRGEREAAYKAAQSIETKFGNDPKRLLEMAGFYLSVERGSDTVRVAESAVKLAPDLAEAHRMLAVGLHISLRLDEAAAEYKKTLELDPASKVSRGSLADLYRAAGKNEEAIQAAQAGIRFLPEGYLAYTNLCRAYNDAKKPEMAIRECNNALKRNPTDGQTFFYLARAYDLVGKQAEATKYYKQAVVGLLEETKKNPNQPDSFYLLGNAYRADNQFDKAIAAYSKCLELSPRYGRARYNLGIIQLLQKNKTAALEQYNLLREFDPELAGKLKVEIDKS